PWLPGVPVGHWARQLEPASQMKAQLASVHSKLQAEFGPQVQEPLAHWPLQLSWFPSQMTWQGPLLQVKSHWLPELQVQSPFPHSARQLESLQAAWHGSLAQLKSQLEPGPQSQSPFAHAPMH